MKNTNDEKQFEEIISRATNLGKVEFDSYKWKEKYLTDDSVKASRSNIKIKQHKNIWRLIMENKVTRYSAAAVIALALTLVLLSPFGTPGNGGVVLADVQKNVAGIETMIIRGTKTFMRPGEDGEIFEFDGIKAEFDLVKYFLKQHGFVEEGYTEDQLFYRITFNFAEGRTLVVLPKYKKYITFTSTDAIKKMMENFATPNGIFNLLLECDYKTLERGKLDGVEVEAFEFQKTELFEELLPKPVFDIQAFKGKVWVGIKEQLPVRIEGDLRVGKSFMTAFNELNLHEVNTLEEFNVEIDEGVFDTSPPEGYTELTLSDILEMIPAETKAGLAGLGIVPVGLIFWIRRRRKKTSNK